MHEVSITLHDDMLITLHAGANAEQFATNRPYDIHVSELRGTFAIFVLQMECLDTVLSVSRGPTYLYGLTLFPK